MTGFTLVELMVSSLILGLTVSAVAFMIINSSVLRMQNDHSRQARIIAQEELEDTEHHFLQYSPSTIMPGFADRALNLDHGETYITVANRNLIVTRGNFPVPPIAPALMVPYQRLVSTVTWTEDGVEKSVTLVKRITQVR